MRRLKANDETEHDYIDVDQLLEMYLEQFQTRKKQILKDLQKEFMKKFAERRDGQFSIDEIDRVVQTCLPLISNSAFAKFPGQFTIRRAFLYSLVCKENTGQVNLVDFLAGCNRFGLDNPTPTIHKRIGLYGNEEDFEDFMKKQLDGYNTQVQVRMHTSKHKNNPIRLETAAKLMPAESLGNTNVISPKNTTGALNLRLLGRAQT